MNLSDVTVLVRGAGEMATGVAWRLYHSHFKMVLTEIPEPLSVRRGVTFSEAVFDGIKTVEGVTARKIETIQERESIWQEGKIPILVDPELSCLSQFSPHVLVEATMAKRSNGIFKSLAPLVLGLGPGFRAGVHVHVIVETNRGHNLGRVLLTGEAEPNTGIPGAMGGYTVERVLRAPFNGILETRMAIGETVEPGEEVARVAGESVRSAIGGILRGLIRPGIMVHQGWKIGDIDPRGNPAYCYAISEKALAIAGGVLEGIMRNFNE